MAKKEATGWVGWIYFGAFMMLLSGIFQAIAGFIALFKEEIYLVGPENLVIFDFSEWGWIHLAFGVVLLLSAFSLMAGNAWGRFFGVFLATLSAIANFGFLNAFPIWSIMVITIDVLIIYALVVHGEEAKG